MRKVFQNIIEEIVKVRRVLMMIIFIMLSLYAAKSFYDLFNPKSDIGYEYKVREEIQAKEVQFDSKIIKNIVEKNIEGKKIPLVTSGRNPFLPY